MSQDFKKQTNKGKAMCDGVGQSLQIKDQQGSTWSASGSSPLRPSLGVFAFEVQDAMGLPKHIVWMRKGVNTQMGQKFYQRETGANRLILRSQQMFLSSSFLYGLLEDGSQAIQCTLCQVVAA